ncbi:efflux RND transporter periplasmic adaptor subunit [uncultured Litoreibacter sp.]|uniref:efflux RND transporter periplasmic adaptor subunit n=1 Tax=uncultured Litoreibacter sp. TaxID=1392394 RepID=UPI00261A6F94|nr:efflux RND transporter periplasmic adaptor subunit [uncultured Litoreibacter sp.]
MRPTPIIIAIIVASALYMLVFERDRLLSFAASDTEEVAPQETVEAEAEPAAEDAASDIRVVSVVALKSQATQIDSAVLVRGRTEAARQIEVRAETSGLVESEPLRKGSYVEAGQLMCEIDPGTRLTALAEAEARVPEAQSRIPEAQARVPEAEGRLAEARARLEEALINDNAAQKLSEDGFASETRVAGTRATVSAARASVQAAVAGLEAAKAGIESARAGVRSAEASVASARKEIDRLDVKAPFSGLLETDTAELGALLQPGSPCATIIQLDPIKLVGFVPENEVAKITTGAMAGARLVSGREVAGRVTFLSRSSDPETRTFRVEVQVPNPDLQIRDGQTAEIIIASEGKTAHLIPASAMTLNDEGTLGVRLAVDGKAQFAPVTILRDTVDGMWVDGLAEQADIIVVGQEYVIDNVAIDVTYREAKG